MVPPRYCAVSAFRKRLLQVLKMNFFGPFFCVCTWNKHPIGFLYLHITHLCPLLKPRCVVGAAMVLCVCACVCFGAAQAGDQQNPSSSDQFPRFRCFLPHAAVPPRVSQRSGGRSSLHVERISVPVRLLIERVWPCTACHCLHLQSEHPPPPPHTHMHLAALMWWRCKHRL